MMILLFTVCWLHPPRQQQQHSGLSGHLSLYKEGKKLDTDLNLNITHRLGNTAR